MALSVTLTEHEGALVCGSGDVGDFGAELKVERELGLCYVDPARSCASAGFLVLLDESGDELGDEVLLTPG